jgi:hypothetical protein
MGMAPQGMEKAAGVVAMGAAKFALGIIASCYF